MTGGLAFGSVCSGIEAASVAWAPLGWRAAFVSEIEPFPAAVLAHRYGSNLPGRRPAASGVPNLGDMTKFQQWGDHAIQLLVGGTPCQSFSVAGLRKGLDDPRGDLMLTYLAIARRYRPRWVVWENVPGVLSSNGGRDFGTFLGGLGECGYGFAYRVLDAQYVRVDGHPRAVAQRRRRVFVVGHLGDWRPAAAVLLEREGLQGHPAPRREARQGVAGTLGGSPQSGGFRTTDLDNSGAFIVDGGAADVICGNAEGGCADGLPFLTASNLGKTVNNQTPLIAGPVTTRMYADRGDTESHLVAHALPGEGFDASEDGTGRGTPLVPVSIDTRNACRDPDKRDAVNRQGAGIGDDCAHTVSASHVNAVAFEARVARNGRGAPSDVVPPLKAQSGETGKGDAAPLVAVAFAQNQRSELRTSEISPQLTTGGGKPGEGYPAVAYNIMPESGQGADLRAAPTDRAAALAASDGAQTERGTRIVTGMAVRRLIPRECERLQGFPDDWTLVPYRGRRADACPDGPRYKALGNSMAVNVMRWIGARIDLFEREVRPALGEAGES